MRAAHLRSLGWDRPQGIVEIDLSPSRAASLVRGCSEQSASGWAELTGVVLGALNCLMAPWWGSFSAYNRP